MTERQRSPRKRWEHMGARMGREEPGDPKACRRTGCLSVRDKGRAEAVVLLKRLASGMTSPSRPPWDRQAPPWPFPAFRKRRHRKPFPCYPRRGYPFVPSHTLELDAARMRRAQGWVGEGASSAQPPAARMRAVPAAMSQ